MRACTMSNGAVFFIADEIEREKKHLASEPLSYSVSYQDLLIQENIKAEPAKKKFSLYDRLMKRDRQDYSKTGKTA